MTSLGGRKDEEMRGGSRETKDESRRMNRDIKEWDRERSALSNMAIMEKNDTYIGRVRVTMVCGCVWSKDTHMHTGTVMTPTQHPFITWLGRCGIQLMRHHSGCYPECIALALQGFTLFGHSLTRVELSAFVQKVQKVTHCCLCMVCVRFLYNEW